MTSLRRRLLVGTGLGTAIILVGSGTVLYALVRASLLREFDKALRDKAASLSALVEQSGDDIVLEFTEEDMIEFQRTQRPEFFQVWREDGTVAGKSPLLKTESLPWDPSASDESVIRVLELPGEIRGRIVLLRFTPRLDDEKPPPESRERLTLALARDTVEVDSSLGQLRALLFGVGIAATLASLGVLAFLVRMGLRPVDRLAKRISLIDEGRLSVRLDPSDSPRELLGIVTTLNEMLVRIDEAFHREKTMTANVAHELRTPLAGIRSTLEVALSRERDAHASRQVMSECLQICTQTQRLVESLLAMARPQAETDLIAPVQTEVGALLRRAWKPYDGLAGERGANVQWDLEEDLQIKTDPEKLQVVFTNVLENAAHYVNEGGTITIHAGRSNGRLHVHVSNTGSKIGGDDVGKVFDPFWRGDASRAATGTHCGLGLSLCKTVMDRLGGAVHAECTPDGRFVVTVIA